MPCVSEGRMYVCVCNAVTEDDVRGCMAEGACTARQIRAACGMKPGCGACTKRLYGLISEYSTASELVDALTGGPLAPVRPVESVEPETFDDPDDDREGGTARPTAA